jgi:hypothetical protein
VGSLRKFFAIGLDDADARVAAALAPRSYAAVDRYLWSSVVVRAFDAATVKLREWWLGSTSGQAAAAAAERWRHEGWAARYDAIAIVLLAAIAVHVALTLMQGPRPGWFWLILPALAAAIALILLAGSRTHTQK